MSREILVIHGAQKASDGRCVRIERHPRLREPLGDGGHGFDLGFAAQYAPFQFEVLETLLSGVGSANRTTAAGVMATAWRKMKNHALIILLSNSKSPVTVISPSDSGGRTSLFQTSAGDAL